VLEVVADRVLMRQQLVDRAARPGTAEVRVNAATVAVIGYILLASLVVDEGAIYLANDRDFLSRAGCQEHPICLDALVLTPRQCGLGVPMFIDQSSAKSKASWASLPIAFLDQAPLACEHLGG